MSTNPRLIQFRFPLTLFPTPGIATIIKTIAEIRNPNRAKFFQRSSFWREARYPSGIERMRKNS